MERKLTDARDRSVDKIVAEAEALADDSPAGLETYIRQYYRSVSAEDLRERTPADLAGAAQAHLQFGRRRQAGTPLLRVYNPAERSHGWSSTHTIVDTVNDDMPFLVDSTTMVLNERGMSIHLTVHPVLKVRRNAAGILTEILPPAAQGEDILSESFVHVEIDRVTDGELLDDIEECLADTLQDVRAAYLDWEAMRAKARELCADLETNPPPLSATAIGEGKALLEWMEEGHFVFLGYREYDLVRGEDEDSLRVIPGTGLGILRKAPSLDHGRLPSRQLRKQARSRDLVIVTKANSRATVHRRGSLDYIGVKVYEGAGRRVLGEKRFLGLWTSIAYSRSPREIPLLRHKIERIMNRSGLQPRSHGGKGLMHILDTFPRDELFQASVEDLYRIAAGIFGLQERQRTRLFLRRDPFRRFFSCLVFVPRDKYNTQIRRRIEDVLMRALNGKSVESNVQLAESNLARVHSIVRTSPADRPKVYLKKIEAEIAESVRSWQDNLRDQLVERLGEEQGLKLLHRYAGVFPAAYEEDIDPRAATFDIQRLADLDEDERSLRMSLYRPPEFPESHVRFKLFHAREPIPISDVLPMLENMGLRVISERPYRVELGPERLVWIQDFEMVYGGSQPLEPAAVNQIFQDAFARIWRGEAESDGFNRLVLGAGLDWWQTALLRAYCRYLLQTGLPFSQAYMEQVMTAYPAIANLLVKEFTARFDPKLRPKRRERALQECAEGLEEADFRGDRSSALLESSLKAAH